NYKCLVDVRIPLTPIHVIIGQNDSGKTSLLEAMLALSWSTERPLDQAFPGEWQDRDLVFEGAQKPVIQFEVRFGVEEGEDHAPASYHLDVEFSGRGRSCRRIDEWTINSEIRQIPEHTQGWTGVARRFDLTSRAAQDDLEAIAERLGNASLYRFDPQLMA